MILYFSGTGNSKHLATLLFIHLKDEITSLNERIKNNDFSIINSNKDNLIIVTPTYAWRMPRLVYEYLTKIKVNNAKNVYFVMSCGGEIGNASKYNKQIANLLNLNFLGTVGILMPDNYIIMFDSPNGEDCVKQLQDADKKILKIIDLIKNNKPLEKTRCNLYDRFMTKVVNNLFYKFYISSKGFYATDDCNGCGKCVNNCPLNNIKLINKKPNWDKNCTHCMKCLSYCPTNAIQYKNKTEKKKAYRIEDYIN